MRSLLLGFIMITPSLFSNEKPKEYPAIDTEFPLLWKAKIGNATFRTNVILKDDNLIIGSNGANFMDYNLYDWESGVYVLNRHNGKVKKKIAGEAIGDMDVCGTLLYNDKLYFGNDNEEFLCTDLNGKMIWRNAASGDIEHEPVLIDHNGKKMIVYASETGEVSAVNPENGKTIWNYYIPDFEGFKTGDNRAVFKIKSYFTNTYSFYTKPILADLNADGTKDLVYLSYDKKLYAINGASGKILWIFHDDKVSTNLLHGFINPNNPQIILNTWHFDEVNKEFNEYVYFLDRFGKLKKRVKVGSRLSYLGLNALSASNDQMIISGVDSIYILKESGIFTGINHSYINSETQTDFNSSGLIEIPENRNSHDQLLANRLFSYKGNGRCVITLNQYDRADYDKAFIELMSLDKKEVMSRFSLKDNSEMPPQIADVNQDGYLDLLVSCKDGYLYCYNMKIKAN